MVTRHFDEPIAVRYRTDSEWKRVLALAVRRSTEVGYEVLIDLGAGEGPADIAWVPRSRIRVLDPASACCTDLE